MTAVRLAMGVINVRVADASVRVCERSVWHGSYERTGFGLVGAGDYRDGICLDTSLPRQVLTDCQHLSEMQSYISTIDASKSPNATGYQASEHDPTNCQT
jgi:hypothetical protein